MVSIVRHRATITKVVNMPVNPKMTVVAGMPMGLLTGGALIEWIGVPATTVIFGLTGILTTLVIVARWRTILTT